MKISHVHEDEKLDEDLDILSYKDQASLNW